MWFSVAQTRCRYNAPTTTATQERMDAGGRYVRAGRRGRRPLPTPHVRQGRAYHVARKVVYMVGADVLGRPPPKGNHCNPVVFLLVVTRTVFGNVPSTAPLTTWQSRRLSNRSFGSFAVKATSTDSFTPEKSTCSCAGCATTIGYATSAGCWTITAGGGGGGGGCDASIATAATVPRKSMVFAVDSGSDEQPAHTATAVTPIISYFIFSRLLVSVCLAVHR